MIQLPTGTVTFLFTDIESSTRLAQEHPDTWESMRQRHHAILQSAMEAQNGYVFQIIGDAFCVAFHNAGDALRAAIASQVGLQAEEWVEASLRVRMGIHTGKAEVQADGQYQGYLAMSRVQRVMSVAYGSQVLISSTTGELVRGELPKSVSLLDLKEHRLKGLINPEHIWQVVAPVLPRDFPPLLSLNDIPNNLPIQLTSFIGREKEVDELIWELSEHRIVTLTGSGGTGKTRLTLQVAAEMIDAFPGGVWFVELAPVTDPGLVPHTLANLLGLRDSGESKQPINEIICAYLQSRRVLLLFDNCEHLIEACAQFADLILHSCKEVKILASSRESLGVGGEVAWRVPSLSLPDVNHLPAFEQLSQFEAVRLFIERASLVQPHFKVTKDNAPAIAQVCHRLDGIPLALELAAARTNVLTVEQISKRLDDRFRLLTGGARTALPRQQTLRAMIDWSYNLLAEEERVLFRRLAVFVGGWTLEAAEEVCSGNGIEKDSILDFLAQLVHKSLVMMLEVNSESRYHSLETIRQYGREKLFESVEAAQIHNKHLDYFLELAEDGYIELEGPHDLHWIEKLETENDNFRGALNWSLESPDVNPLRALQLSGALRDFWDTRGYISEGSNWLTLALKNAPQVPSNEHCRALFAAGLMKIRLSNYIESSKLLEQSLAMARHLNNPPLLIKCLLYTGDSMEDRVEARNRIEAGLALAREEGDLYDLAYAYFLSSDDLSTDASEAGIFINKALEATEELGNSRLHAGVLWYYGGMEMRKNHYAPATSMLQEALGFSRSLKDKHLTAHILLMLGRIATRKGLFAEARQYELESLHLLRDLIDRGCCMQCLFHLGWNSFLAGEPSQAAEYFDESYSMCSDVNFKDAIIVPLSGMGLMALLQGDIPKAKVLYLEAMTVFKRTPESPYYFAYCLEAICAIPGIPPGSAAKILGRAEAIREQKGFYLPPIELHLVEPTVAKLQLQLGKVEFDSLRNTGRELTNLETIDIIFNALEIIG